MALSCSLYINQIMEIYTQILGNIYQNKEWKDKLKSVDVENVQVDQWTAQKSRFLAFGDKGNEYAVALKRHSSIMSGDLIYYSPEENRAIVLQVEMNPVLVIELGKLFNSDPEKMMQTAFELGHAIGNQHWPAVFKETRIFVPLTVDKKVMLSVMETHHIENITYEFQKAIEIVPYLAPHEVRRLFGSAAQESHSHEHVHDAYEHHHKAVQTE
jgi:Urease accessory protein UreE